MCVVYGIEGKLGVNIVKFYARVAAQFGAVYCRRLRGVRRGKYISKELNVRDRR